MKKLILLLLVLCVPALAKDRQWQTGIVVSFDKKTFADADDTRVYVLSLQVKQMQYVAERELPFAAQKAPMFTEGSEVKFSLDGDKLIAVEDNGREFKMKLVKKKLSP